MSADMADMIIPLPLRDVPAADIRKQHAQEQADDEAERTSAPLPTRFRWWLMRVWDFAPGVASGGILSTCHGVGGYPILGE